MQLIIPAAGCGTRLAPLTDTCAKEMLPVGGRPMIAAALLEAQHAGVDAVIVGAPAKPALKTWAHGRARWVEQPEPLGSMHAVACADPTAPYAVLYPDYVHAHGQTALAGLIETAGTRPEATWFGVHRVRADMAKRLGPTARVVMEPDGRITAVEAGWRENAWHTAFAEIRGLAHARRIAAGPLDDARLLPILRDLAAAGLLYGHPLPVDVLDLGIHAGYADACARFADGRAAWRSA
jgi:hypothetical protein